MEFGRCVFLVQFSFSKIVILDSFWQILAQNRNWGKKLVIPRGWLKMKSLCPNSATLRWHTYCILHIDPKCGIWKVRFFGSFLLFKNCHFAQFLANLGSEPKFEGGKKLVITRGWLKMRRLCSNSATLRWHTYRILHINPKCGIWKVRFFGSFLLFKNCHFAQFLANLGSEPKFEGGKKLVITRGWLKMRRLCSNSATLRWHTYCILHIDPKCGIFEEGLANLFS